MSIVNKPDYKVFAQDAKSGEIETFPDVLRGWGVTLDRTAGKPPLEWFNAIGKRVDEWLMYLSQRGLAEWDSTVDYPQYAAVQHSGKFYVALKQNISQQPDRSQNNWQLMADFLGAPKLVLDALNTKQDKGDYATNSALNDVRALANTANNNANTKLSKSQNGADIPDKSEFVKNLGLTETVNKANNAVPSSRKINGKALTGDVSLSAGDVGAISTNGGNYPEYFRFKQVETIPNERNATMLVSESGGKPTSTMVAFTSYAWYDNYIKTGIVRGGSVDTLGYAVDINAKRVLTVSPDGKVNTTQFIAQSFIAGSGGMQAGTKDAASFDGNNVELISWFGIGLRATIDQKTRIFFNTRNGDIFTKGTIHIGDAIHYYDGNTTGSIWGGDLHSYINNNFSRKNDGVPVGSPIPWPLPNPPSGYLTCNGQTFDKSLYPKLAEAYPAGRVPDLRGEFIRGWDDSRGVDPGRVCGTWQGDAIRNITGGFVGGSWDNPTGAFYRTIAIKSYTNYASNDKDLSYINFDASRVVPVASENRPRNIAFNYIVRAI
ncbi:tail fiber protein [Photorhabdus akhurstii]|uniref:tail fiber protein n=1 Tax=Photorhabdus akhurstii TaxID=171438 RepID=UPI003703906A